MSKKVVPKPETRHNKYANPRRLLTASKEQLQRWDEAATAADIDWSEWARTRLDAAASAEASKRRK